MKRLVMYFAATLMSVAAFAQRAGEVTDYRKNSDLSEIMNDTLLYVSPNFLDGRVIFKDMSGSNAKVNISTVAQRVEFIEPSTGDTLSLANESDVNMVIMGPKTYYKTRYGYAQILKSYGDCSLAYVRDMIVENQQAMTSYGRIPASSTATTVNAITDLGGTNNSSNAGKFRDLKYEMKIRPVILIKGTKAYLGNRKAFYKAFPKYKDLVDQLAYDNKTDFNDMQSVYALFDAVVANIAE